MSFYQINYLPRGVKKESLYKKTSSSQNSTEDPGDLSTAQKTPVISVVHRTPQWSQYSTEDLSNLPKLLSNFISNSGIVGNFQMGKQENIKTRDFRYFQKISSFTSLCHYQPGDSYDANTVICIQAKFLNCLHRHLIKLCLCFVAFNCHLKCLQGLNYDSALKWKLLCLERLRGHTVGLMLKSYRNRYPSSRS